MQIHELTRKSRINEGAAANIPLMISQAAQNMQRQWSQQVSQALAADAVTDTARLSPQSKTALKKALNSIVAQSQFLGGMDFTNLSQMVSQTDDNGAYTPVYINQADTIMNRLYAGVRQLGNLDVEKVDKLPEKTKKEVMRAFKKATDPSKPFKIKEIYSAHRKFFKDFVIFNREEDRRLFNAVEGQRIILVDDYKTSGTTIKEMLRQLSDAGAAEVVVFVLLKIGE
jgi:phosphoribosylpyrophosphate synthetase